MTTPITHFIAEHEFLSNFYPSPFDMADGITYPTAEHAFQAQKTLDMDTRRRIAALPTPAAAKAAGKRVKLRANWNDIRVGLMYLVLHRKFQRGTVMSQLLLATGDRDLVEGNTWNDTFWGVCRGRGQNQLGITLMQIRDALREEGA